MSPPPGLCRWPGGCGSHRVGHHRSPRWRGWRPRSGRKEDTNGQSSGGNRRGAPTCRQGRRVCGELPGGRRAPFQPFGDHAKAALLSQCLSCLEGGPRQARRDPRPGNVVHGKGQRRDSASCRGGRRRVVTVAATGSSVMTMASSDPLLVPSQLSGGASPGPAFMYFHISTQ